METVANDCKHKDCRYRLYVSFLGESCLYMYYTGKRRGCGIRNCNKYLPGTIEKIHTLNGMIYRGIDDDL